MRIRNISKKMVSLALTIAIIGTGSGINALANSVNDGKNSQKATDNKVTVVKELTDERTENSNTYLLSDGSKKTELFLSNIRYEKDGQLKDYENEIVDIGKNGKKSISTYGSGDKSSYKYVNKSSDNKAYFSDDIEDGIMLSHGKYILKMTPVIEEENDDINKDDKNTSQSNDNNEFECIKNEESNELKYISESKNMEYQYSVNNCGVKENIVLNEKPETNIFEYKIETKNLYLKKQENDKGLLVYDKNTNKIIGTIEAPFLVDADGKEDYKSVEYKLEKDGENEMLKVIVSNDYFENEATKYPVTIDPTMVWMFDYLTTASVWSVDFQQNVNMHNHYLGAMNNMISSYPYNSEEHVYLDTSNLLTGSALVGSGLNIRGKYIESASLNLYESSYRAPYQVGTLELRTAKDSWNPDTITWNNKPGASEEVLLEEKFTGVEGTRHCLDITKWVQDIADEQIENNGLVFTAKKGGAALFYGPEAHYIQDENGTNSESRHMSIYLTYRDFEPYDASINISAEYDKQSNSIITSIEDDNKLKEGVSVTGYKIFTRKDNALKFSAKYKGTDISEDVEINASNVDECIDIRAAILYSDGTVKVSNIVTLEKTEDGDSDDGGNSFEITSKDTDGDGLEDGYEIWDFKTMWNTETADSTEDNPKYEQDTDGDGLPDGYEVFTLGTDPAVANEENADSDGDGWTDLKEYQKGTDPWLVDSDFDGINDKSDSKPRETNKKVSQIEIANSKVHIGLYDIEVKEIENDVLVSQIVNVYNGRACQKHYNYNDGNFNKWIKYFYDNSNNCTAVIESYDKEYDPNGKKTIGVTYSYDKEGNITVLCDQSTRYICEYANSELLSLKIGNVKIVSYDQENLVNNLNENGEDNNISVGDVITENIQTTSYGNNQNITKKSITYKTEDSNKTQIAQIDKIYYDDTNKESYIIKYNNEGKILEVLDYTSDNEEDISERLPITYKYTYDGDKIKIVRGDSFIKEEEKMNDGSCKSIITKYHSKDIKNNIDEHITSKKIMATDEKNTSICTLFNNDKLTAKRTNSNDEDIVENVLFSQLYNKNIYKITDSKESDGQTKYTVELYGQTKCFTYNYDREGRIISVNNEDEVLYSYEYDAHGRLIVQKDCVNKEGHEYIYNNTGNIYADWKYPLDENNKIINAEGNVKYYEYDNVQWEDQLTAYNGENLKYDTIGNPIEYINEMKFTWSRGRNLETVYKKEKEVARYKYNEKGLRINKTTESIETEYFWDENKLIRECVTYKKTGKKYDIWYFFDENDDVIGFEYAKISSMDGNLKKTRIYYEKDKQGDVIGLLDSRGAEIAIYEYDVWGNVINSICYEGYEEAYKLNNIEYRGYYKDGETGFYYLKNRYYDSNIGRFINASDSISIMGEVDLLGQNMYSYCLYKPSQYITLDNNNEILLGKKKYKGQETGAYGYGGIVSPYDYVKDRYGGSISVSQAKTLTMRNFVMSDLEGNANNCSLVAITRVLNYYSLNGYKKIPTNNLKLYKKVKSVGKKYGYTASKGTGPTKINNIVNDVTKYYGYGKSKCNGIYLWWYNGQVKGEIDKNRPVIMNIVGGYYGNHSVTVCGYIEYRKKHKIGKVSYYSYYRMIEVYDGWSSTRHYIDYNAFARSQLGSFNTTIMKK